MSKNDFFTSIRNLFLPPPPFVKKIRNILHPTPPKRIEKINKFQYIRPPKIAPRIRISPQPSRTRPIKKQSTMSAMADDGAFAVPPLPPSDVVIERIYYNQNEDLLYLTGSNLQFDKFNNSYKITIKNEHLQNPIVFSGNTDARLLSAITTSSFFDKIIINTSIDELRYLKYDTNSGSILFTKPGKLDYDVRYSFENGIDPEINDVLANSSGFLPIEDSLLISNAPAKIFQDSSKTNTIAVIGIVENVNNEAAERIDDKVRSNGKKYWNFSSSDIRYGISDNVKYNIFVSSSGENDTWVRLSSEGKEQYYQDEQGNYLSTKWIKFINGVSETGNVQNMPIVDTSSVFTDIVYDFSSPYSSLELKRTNTQYKSLFCSVQQKYNFYIKEYENLMTTTLVDEKILPNMYVMVSEQKTANKNTANQNFKDLITLKGEIDESYLPSKMAKGDYYEEYSNKYLNLKNSNNLQKKRKFEEINSSLANKYANILLSQKDLNIIREYNDKKELFPMFIQIDFATDKSTEFAQVLKDTKLNDMFLQALVNKFNDFENLGTIQKTEQITIDNEGNTQKINAVDISQKRKIDLADILTEVYEGRANSQQNSIFLGDYEQSKSDLTSPEYNFFKTLMFGVLEGKLKNLIKKYDRTYSDILNGKKCYNETVCYRVEKRLGGQTVQNYWIMNSSDLDIVSLIDTQVKYNTNYEYAVFSYEMVLSSEYSYSNFITDLDKNVAFKVKKESGIPIIIEQEYFRKQNVKIIDTPPIKPEITFIPYKGVDDKILILLNSSVGKIEEQPVSILDSDSQKFNELRMLQEKLSFEPLSYESDDPAKSYEIYRTEIPPKKYRDFRQSLRVNKLTDTDSNSDQSASSTAYLDTIMPNKKYYYTVRSIDQHDHVSNPTEVFEVQMINEKGTIFPIIKPFFFEESPKTLTKNAKRFIQIQPMILQTRINEQKSGYGDVSSAKDVNKVVLGNIDGSVWDKNFLIRVTSKSTGKKIDFKVKFVVKTEKGQ